MKINDFFEKIYCINLDERPDRWVRVQKEFNKLGIENVERFSAIKHGIGSLGCRNSHLEIIKISKEKNFKNVLIFEDDVLFLTKNIEYIEKALNDLNSIDWDLFYFGATIDPNIGYLKKITENLLLTNFAYTTHAYAVNNKIFDKILNEVPNFNIIDVYYCMQIVRMGKSYIINPMIAIQEEGFSNIENHQADYGWMLDFFNNIKTKSGII